MGNNICNHPLLDCGKHETKAKKCKFVKLVYQIDDQCALRTNCQNPEFDAAYHDILKPHKKRKSGEKYIAYLDACNHVMKYHANDMQQGYLNQLAKSTRAQPCDLANCRMLRRNYDHRASDRTINNNQMTGDLQQQNFFQDVDSFHEFLHHHQNDADYLRTKRGFIENWNSCYFTQSTLRFAETSNLHQSAANKPNNIFSPSSNSNSNSNDDDESEDEYYFPDSDEEEPILRVQQYLISPRHFSYDSTKKRSRNYVGAHYKHLRDELLNECNLSEDAWNLMVVRACTLAQTAEIKCIRHRQQANKALSMCRILIICTYTSCDQFQTHFNEIARKTIPVRTDQKLDSALWRQAKRLHSRLSHSFKLLVDTVQDYGSEAAAGMKPVYRGIGFMPKFSQYLIPCNLPTSTSKSKWAASSFSGGSGCILELTLPQNCVYLPVQFMSKYRLEFEVLLFGKRSFVFMEKVYRFAAEIDLRPLVMLEALICAPAASRWYQQKQFDQAVERVLAQWLCACGGNRDGDHTDQQAVFLQTGFDYFVAGIRELYLKSADLMRLINGGAESRRLDIGKVMGIFQEARCLTVCKSYQADIEDIFGFCQLDGTDAYKLREIVVYHHYDKQEMKRLRARLLTEWPLNCKWEIFCDAVDYIKCKKYEKVKEDEKPSWETKMNGGNNGPMARYCVRRKRQ